MGTEPVGRGAGPLTMSPFWLIYVICKYRMLAMLLGKGGGGSCGNSLLTGRHECAELQGLSVSDFSRIDFTSLRKSAENKPPYRAVICGALLSPACVQDQQVFSTTCPWCDNTLGHWYHVVWECPSRPSTLRRPNSPVCARFGWGASRQEIEWLQVAAQAIWSVRHGNAAFD